MGKYINFKKELLEVVIEYYNLLPEEIRELMGEGIEVFKDGSKVYNFIKIYNSFKERFLIKKIERFLKNTESLSSNEIIELMEKCEQSKEKFIEQLIIMIDRLESEEKVEYFSKLFMLFAKKEIEKTLYFRYCKILENNSYYDIVSFSKEDIYSIEKDKDMVAFSMKLLQERPKIKGELISAELSNRLVLSEAGKVFLKLNELIK